MSGLSVVITGNPVDGFRTVGPFKQPHYASEWADEWLPGLDWWVQPLDHPEVFENDEGYQQQGSGADR